MKKFVWLILLNVCEAIVPITGFFVWRFIRDMKVKVFVIYSLFIITSELLSRYLTTHQMKEENTMLFNYVVIPVEFLFLIWFLFSYMPGKKMMKLCILFSIIVISSQVVNLTLFEKEKFFFFSFSYIISTLVLLISILLFLWRFIRINNPLNYDKHFIFWVALASLIYYLGTFPLFAFYNYLYKTHINIFNLYWQIHMALDMLMYLLFSTALIWTSIKYKSSLG